MKWEMAFEKQLTKDPAEKQISKEKSLQIID